MANWRDRTFLARGAKIPSPVKGKVEKATLGVRPEDCTIVAPSKGHILGEIYTNELIGDHTLVTVKSGSDLLAVKAAKDYAGKAGERVGVGFEASHTYIFNAADGSRVR